MQRRAVTVQQLVPTEGHLWRSARLRPTLPQAGRRGGGNGQRDSDSTAPAVLPAAAAAAAATADTEGETQLTPSLSPMSFCGNNTPVTVATHSQLCERAVSTDGNFHTWILETNGGAHNYIWS